MGITYLILTREDQTLGSYVLPELQVARIQLKNLTDDKADLELMMIINNKVPVELTLDSLQYSFLIDSNQVVKSTYPNSIHLNKNDSSFFSLPLTIYYKKLRSVIKKIEQQGKDSANYKIKATVYSDTFPFPNDQVDLEVEKRRPLIHPPVIQIVELGVGKVSLSGTTINVKVSVHNRNNYSVAFKYLQYSLQLADNEALKGQKEEIINIPGKKETIFEIPVEIDLGEAGESLISLIKEGDELTYKIMLNGTLVSKVPAIDGSKIEIVTSGEINEIKEGSEEKK